MPTPHLHAALIKQWADDTDQPVWFWNGNIWASAGKVPSWYPHYAYIIGPQPTQAPARPCVLGGIEFPMPETVAPPHRTPYFMPCIKDGVLVDEWGGYAFDNRMLELGIVHRTREAAGQHSRALLAANKQAVEAAL